jgi:competence protein ComGC
VLLVICIGPLFAIPAIICGHLGFSRVRRSGGVLIGEGMALAGLIMGYVGVVLALAWIPLALAVFVPSFAKAREATQKRICLNNLKRIGGAKEVWALRNNKDTNSTPTMQDLTPFLTGNIATLRCPAGGTYSINRVGVPPSCSIASHDLFNPGSTIQEILNDRTNSAR